ncbi:MAG: cache domain-containing protein [Actinomycetota bacterium]|nr:cache domain-containing protein [Actinomycetota bacterium]
MNEKWPKKSTGQALSVRQSAIVVLVIVLVFVIVLFAPAYFWVDKLVVTQKIGDLKNMADSKEVHVLDFLRLGKALNRQWAEDPTVRDALVSPRGGSPTSSVKLNETLNSFRSVGKLSGRHAFGLEPFADNEFHEVSVVDAGGKIVASTARTSVGRNVKGTDIFALGKNGTRITPAFRDTDGDVVFAFVSPIKEQGTGRFLGVFATKVSTQFLSSILNSDLGNLIGGHLWFAGFQYRSLDVYLMNKQGTMITQSRLTTGHTALRVKGSTFPLVRAKTGGTGTRVSDVGIRTSARDTMDIYRNPAKLEVAGAAVPISDPGWVLVVEQQTKDAFVGLIWLERAIVIAGILIAALTGLLVWAGIRPLANSIGEIVAASIRVASGNLDTYIDPKMSGYSDIAALAGSFNLMTDEMKKKRQALTDYEHRVQERDFFIQQLMEYLSPAPAPFSRASVNKIVEQAIVRTPNPRHIQVVSDLDAATLMAAVDQDRLRLALAGLMYAGIQRAATDEQLAVATGMPPGLTDIIQITIAYTGAPIAPDAGLKAPRPEMVTESSQIDLAVSLAKLVIEQHRGSVDIATDKESGKTVITIKIPAKLEQAA